MPKCWFVCWTFGHHPSCSWSCPCISSLTHLVFGMDALCFPCDMATGAALAGHHVPDQDVKHLQRRWRDCQCRIGPWTEQEDQALRKSVEKLGLQYGFGSDFWHWGCDKSDVVVTVSRPEWTNWWLRQRNIEGSRFPCGLLTHYIVLLCTSRNLIPKPELIFGNVLWMIHVLSWSLVCYICYGREPARQAGEKSGDWLYGDFGTPWMAPVAPHDSFRFVPLLTSEYSWIFW